MRKNTPQDLLLMLQKKCSLQRQEKKIACCTAIGSMLSFFYHIRGIHNNTKMNVFVMQGKRMRHYECIIAQNYPRNMVVSSPSPLLCTDACVRIWFKMQVSCSPSWALCPEKKDSMRDLTHWQGKREPSPRCFSRLEESLYLWFLLGGLQSWNREGYQSSLWEEHEFYIKIAQ